MENIKIQAFELSQEQAKDVVMVSPSWVDYNLYLENNQRIELSESGKMAFLMQENQVVKRFNVSKTVFGLKEGRI